MTATASGEGRAGAASPPDREAPAPRPPRVLIVGENASMKMGGEASYPYLFFKLLRARGIEAWLVAHARTRDELRTLLGDDFDRALLAEESRLDIFLWKIGNLIPRKISEQTIGVLRHILTHRRLRKLARRLIAEQGVDVVHETTPIAPRVPSAMHDLGAPLVVGPLSGGMDYPPAFQYMQSGAARAVEKFGRAVAAISHRLAPGRLKAAALVVANPQTRAALPKGARGAVYEGISEVSVDLENWRCDGPLAGSGGPGCRFLYLGRLVDWKAVDLLLEAFARVAAKDADASLEILGDGSDRAALEALAGRLGIRERTRFAGWVAPTEGASRMRAADVFVLPSLRESGGIVLMEAMAVGLPVITTRWGGPGVHVDDECGIRVEPSSREAFIAGLADAMLKLAGDPDLRERMGRAGRLRVASGTYDWERKIDRFLEIYREAIDREAAGAPRPSA